MLAIHRNIGESIKVGDNIFIKYVRIDGKRITLSFDAPQDVKIVRTELLTKKEAENDHR